MSDVTTSSAEIAPLRRILILVSVILATTLYGTTILVVSTILPQMRGSFSATNDEISWVMTFNILATAIVTPMTGWLAARFGRKRVMVWSLTGFTVATFMCGAVHSLEGIVFWRVMQGAFGAPSTPLAQSIIMDTFPRHQHSMVIGIFGFGVVIGPVIGPTLGGYMAEAYTWRWAFYSLVPIGAIAILGLNAFLLPDEAKKADAKPPHLDWTGFLALSVSLAATQLVLSRGQRLDWFESSEIVIETFIAFVAFWIFAAHCLTSKQPFLNPRHLTNRNYTIGLVLVTLYGMVNFTPMVLLPPLLREHAGFPDLLVGIIIAGRGVGGMFGFLIAGFASRADPRIFMSIGFGMLITAGIWLMAMDLNVTVISLIANAFLQGLAIGTIWVPLTVVTFANVSREDMAETTSIFHLMRNLGSSFFISILVAEIVRSSTSNYSRMVEMITPFNKMLTLPDVLGRWDIQTTGGLAHLGKEIARQSAMIGYLNAFGMYTVACALTLPLILLMGRRAGDKK
ncbi:MAG TPA: DHA2 family efflux MFS transporter permease subunit [Hyphomicrobiaceae bacterium]|nr:DHA2 family efflux MFS transporter permease subunit [Hyphomicrobiaceae bacterium]